MERDTKIICGFPGVGKTYFYDNNYIIDLYILDSDSSKFSWKYDINGIKTDKRNPDFPDNYIKHIKDNLGIYDIIFVSTHDIVRKALIDNKLKHYIIIPNINDKSNYIKRYIDRGDNNNFVSFMVNNFDLFINDIYNNKNEYSIIYTLKENEYIEDFISRKLIPKNKYKKYI